MSMGGLERSTSASLFSWGDRLTSSGRRWTDMWRAIGAATIDLLYPPSCIACQAAVGEADGLCAPCWARITFIERPFCERLGAPFPFDLGDGLLSPSAASDPPVFGRARAVAKYEDGPVRLLVQGLKYGDRTELARPMGRWMARAGRDLIAHADLLAPVPLHWMRRLQRRYNQAAELAREISKATGIPHNPFLLERVKPTRPQVGLSKSGRATNVQGAFRASNEREAEVAGRNILLIDDVLTSGATLNACSRALLRAGAAGVDVLVFARVVNDK